jgi:hypothetical protein
MSSLARLLDPCRSVTRLSVDYKNFTFYRAAVCLVLNFHVPLSACNPALRPEVSRATPLHSVMEYCLTVCLVIVLLGHPSRVLMIRLYRVDTLRAIDDLKMYSSQISDTEPQGTNSLVLNCGVFLENTRTTLVPLVGTSLRMDSGNWPGFAREIGKGSLVCWPNFTRQMDKQQNVITMLGST